MEILTDEQFLADFCDRWLIAWNSHVTEQLVDLLAPDVVWEDLTFWPEVITGREGVRAYIEQIWRVMPDVQFEEIERFFAPGRRKGIVLFKQTGSPPPTFAGHPKFATHGCDIFLDFDSDGRLARYLASYDLTEMMRQMRLLPERRGQLGGSYLRSLAGAIR
jgi:steroid delta-isomerase-like uncharacterized protein